MFPMTDQQKEPYTKGEKKYTIEFDREACIGLLCVLRRFPENWVMNQDGKPDLIYTEIGEDRLKENIEGSRSLSCTCD